MWWAGDIASAIQAIVSQNKFLVVVASGSNSASQDVEKIFESPIMHSKVQPHCIALRLQEGTKGFTDFNQFWTIEGTPMIFFMNSGGEMIRDPLKGTITQAQILRTAVGIINEKTTPGAPSEESSSSTNSNMPSETPGTSESSETAEEKAARLAEKAEEYRQKIDAVREQKAKEAAEKKRQDEIRRREEGKKMAEAKRKREEDELKLIANRNKRAAEKKADAEHLARVRAQIEEDKRNRAAAFNAEKTQRDAETNRLREEKLRAEREKQEEIQRAKASKARLSIRLGNGTSVTYTFEADDPLQNARDLLVSDNKVEGPFKFRQMMPNRLIAKDEETKTMRDLGLAPSAVLIVVQDVTGTQMSQSGIVGWLWALIFFPINLLIRGLGSIFAPNTAPPPRQPATTSSTQRPQRRRIADLQDDADRPTYNGNSTNQL